MKHALLIFVAVLWVSGPAKASDPDTGELVMPEPIRCYVMAGSVPGGMTVGLGVTLCSSTTDAEKTIQCFVKAYSHPDNGGLGLNRGLAVTLCKSNSMAL